MKHSTRFSQGVTLFPVIIFLILCNTIAGQETSEQSAPLPDNINKIVSVSCMPCHSSSGGMLSKAKLNFTEWTSYSVENQKKKAGKIYKELKKSDMPPKEARESNPDIIPTRDQIQIIKTWANSF